MHYSMKLSSLYLLIFNHYSECVYVSVMLTLINYFFTLLWIIMDILIFYKIFNMMDNDKNIWLHVDCTNQSFSPFL